MVQLCPAVLMLFQGQVKLSHRGLPNFLAITTPSQLMLVIHLNSPTYSLRASCRCSNLSCRLSRLVPSLPCKCRILLYAGSTGCWHGANDNKVATAHHDDDTVFDESSSKRSCHQPNNRPSYRYINPPLYLNNNNNKQVEWVHLYQAFC